MIIFNDVFFRSIFFSFSFLQPYKKKLILFLFVQAFLDFVLRAKTKVENKIPVVPTVLRYFEKSLFACCSFIEIIGLF
jgi:hypothetical protein